MLKLNVTRTTEKEGMTSSKRKVCQRRPGFPEVDSDFEIKSFVDRASSGVQGKRRTC